MATLKESECFMKEISSDFRFVNDVCSSNETEKCSKHPEDYEEYENGVGGEIRESRARTTTCKNIRECSSRYDCIKIRKEHDNYKETQNAQSIVFVMTRNTLHHYMSAMRW